MEIDGEVGAVQALTLGSQQDRLFMSVRKNGKRCLLYMDKFEPVGNNPDSPVYMDFSVKFWEGSGTSIAVPFDGKCTVVTKTRIYDATATGGYVDIKDDTEDGYVGLTYKAVIAPMPMETSQNGSTTANRIKKITAARLRLFKTGMLKYGRDEDNLEEVVFRHTDMVGNQMIKPFTGDVFVRTFPGDYDYQATITLVSDEPKPFTVLSIMPEVSVND
jgi:hypothetical protein